MSKKVRLGRFGRRLGACGVGVGVAVIGLTVTARASADERHCVDANIKAAVLSKLGAPGQRTDLAVASATLDEQRGVTGDARAPSVVVATPSAASKLQIAVASDAGLDVLVCVYGRETTAAWRDTKSTSAVHGSFGADAPDNKGFSHFVLDAKQKEGSYGYVNRADSSQPSDRVVAVILSPTRGAAKYSIGLNKPAPALAGAPASAPQSRVIGVDRGASFSAAAADAMNQTREPNRNLCLRAVKRTLFKTNALRDWNDPTLSAKDFVSVMRDPTKIRGYRELTQTELAYDYNQLKSLKDRLPVGSVIVYRNNTPNDIKAPSPIHGHIEVVAEVNGVKSLVSDHVSPYDHGWGWLGASKTRKIDMWIFVPTEENRVLVADPIDLTQR